MQPRKHRKLRLKCFNPCKYLRIQDAALTIALYSLWAFVFSVKKAQIQVRRVIWNRNNHKNTPSVRVRGLKRSFEVFGEQWLAGSMLI